MKKLFLVVLILMLFTCVPVLAGDFAYVAQGDGAVLLSYHGTKSDVWIPGELGGLPVTVIADGAFLSHTGLERVVIPGSVEYIENGAFGGCGNLREVVLTEGLRTIGDFAFAGCVSLPGIRLPDSVITVGTGAFSECAAIKSITIPERVQSVGGLAFARCGNLLSVTFRGRNTQIGEQILQGCDGVRINGFAGSSAEAYAAANGYAFGAKSDAFVALSGPFLRRLAGTITEGIAFYLRKAPVYRIRYAFFSD